MLAIRHVGGERHPANSVGRLNWATSFRLYMQPSPSNLGPTSQKSNVDEERAINTENVQYAKCISQWDTIYSILWAALGQDKVF